ncbi:type I-G CRISPR-associated protein Cas8g1/Csx17 [Desulfohalobium retbaense]|uniref:CRISPR-associated protein Csx17 n=1 Tax=Desulfohalobium retbaense (strain ATCC 49708 / DSM 5692 / JCM 16813 / HR100) TaxID=485915 RepID=C8X3B0_DESRD|nr:type I-U CRISPR-associated protein Csx17 [Desulfohalobium retbaense]ACV68907.1 hypothetical protein Dret_1623 [Desulfohalobium retbaense DSM 5692]
MHEYTLPGCSTRPLGSYLKGLAVFRLVAEQKDPDVTAWWDKGTFRVHTRLAPEELTSFFCEQYTPTPIITPWNGGSSFYPGDNTEGLEAIVQTGDSRFRIYKEAIEAVSSWPEWGKNVNTVRELMAALQGMISSSNPGKKQDELFTLQNNITNLAEKVKTTEGGDPLGMRLVDLSSRASEKAEVYKQLWNTAKKARTVYTKDIREQTKKIILPLCRSRLPDACLEWLDALCAIHADGEISYHQVLGSGGNDARLDFGNNFMKKISALLLGSDQSASRKFLSASLWGTSVEGLPKTKIGQFDPGRAGGYNQGMGIEAKDFTASPWDFILTIEGTLLLASSVGKRQGVSTGSTLTSPFTVRFSPVGFTSNVYTEPEGPETEIWMPLWNQPARYGEIKQLFSEGRCSIGKRQAKSGLEFSRAVGTLGVDRGITAFERYGFLKRRGENKVALPAGKIAVRFKPSLELVNELDPLLSKLDQFLRAFKKPPTSFLQARQKIDQNIFNCTLQPDPVQFLKIVRSLGQMEKRIALRDRDKDPKLPQPLFGLSPQWIIKSDDGSPETRIAAALASIHSTGKVGPIRSNMAGVRAQAPWHWEDRDSQQHWFGSDLTEKLGNVLTYRLMDAERKSVSNIPFMGNLELSPYDVMPFLHQETKDDLLEDLLWGFTLINWRKSGIQSIRNKWEKPTQQTVLSRTWCLLKLLHHPNKIKGHSFKREKSISHLLQAHRVDEACNKATQRLRISNLHPFPIYFEEELEPQRLLASLMLPVKDQHILENLVLERTTITGETHA